MQFPPAPWVAAVAAFCLLFVATAHAAPKDSFTTAKRLASVIYKDHKTTFYCGCAYDAKKRVNASSCGYSARKNPKRGKRIEWEHVVPAQVFGSTRACWRPKACKPKRGKPYGGRKCCQDSDPVYRTMENDLHNIVPAIGELNADRSYRPFGMVWRERREYGACDFEIDWDSDVVEPEPRIRGDIARIYFYMRSTYGIPIGNKQQRLFETWAKEDPVDLWEQTKAERIRALKEKRSQ